MLRSILLAVFCFSYSLAATALPKVVQEEIEGYIKIFETGLPKDHKSMIAKLEWAGISDPRLFDPIEAKLLSTYMDVEDKYEADYLSWMAKALAFSGLEKYRKTLHQVGSGGGHKKLRKHAKQSINILANYSVWNQVIIDESSWDASLEADLNRFLSMVRSDHMELKRIVAKRVYHGQVYNDSLLDLLEQQLLKNYEDAESSLDVDTWSWVCKGLARSGGMKYKHTINLVAESADNKKLRKYAKKSLKYLRS